jgi:hypothetical protein
MAVLSALIVCKGLLYGTALLAIIGVSVDIPPGPWAAAVDIAVILAVATFWFSRRRHGMLWPTLLAVVGALLVIGRMHGPAPVELEWMGLVLLLVAAAIDWEAGKRNRMS